MYIVYVCVSLFSYNILIIARLIVANKFKIN